MRLEDIDTQEIWNYVAAGGDWTADAATHIMLVKLSCDILLTDAESSELQLLDRGEYGEDQGIPLATHDGNGLNVVGSAVAKYGRDTAHVTSAHLEYLVKHVATSLDCSPSMVSITYEGNTGAWTVEVKYSTEPNAPSYYAESPTRSLGDLVGAAAYAIQVVRSGRLRHGRKGRD